MNSWMGRESLGTRQPKPRHGRYPPPSYQPAGKVLVPGARYPGLALNRRWLKRPWNCFSAPAGVEEGAAGTVSLSDEKRVRLDGDIVGDDGSALERRRTAVFSAHHINGRPGTGRLRWFGTDGACVAWVGIYLRQRRSRADNLRRVKCFGVPSLVRIFGERSPGIYTSYQRYELTRYPCTSRRDRESCRLEADKQGVPDPQRNWNSQIVLASCRNWQPASQKRAEVLTDTPP